jgi:hypothetical protein
MEGLHLREGGMGTVCIRQDFCMLKLTVPHEGQHALYHAGIEGQHVSMCLSRDGLR